MCVCVPLLRSLSYGRNILLIIRQCGRNRCECQVCVLLLRVCVCVCVCVTVCVCVCVCVCVRAHSLSVSVSALSLCPLSCHTHAIRSRGAVYFALLFLRPFSHCLSRSVTCSYLLPYTRTHSHSLTHTHTHRDTHTHRRAAAPSTAVLAMFQRQVSGLAFLTLTNCQTNARTRSTRTCTHTCTYNTQWSF